MRVQCACGLYFIQADNETMCLFCREHPEDRPVPKKIELPKTKKPVPYWQEKKWHSNARTDARRAYEREHKRAWREAHPDKYLEELRKQRERRNGNG